MKFTSTVGKLTLKSTNHSVLVLNISITEQSIETEKRSFCPNNGALGKCSLMVLWSSEDASCTEDSVFAYEKSKFGSKHCCLYQKTPILQPVPPASLISILRKFYFVLFSWILPRWLRLHSQAVELKTSLCSCLSRFWPPTLYDVNPKLAWHHRLIVCSDLALCAYAPNPRSTSETRACSFLPLFWARTRMLLKKGWKCYSKNGRCSQPFILLYFLLRQ